MTSPNGFIGLSSPFVPNISAPGIYGLRQQHLLAKKSWGVIPDLNNITLWLDGKEYAQRTRDDVNREKLSAWDQEIRWNVNKAYGRVDLGQATGVYRPNFVPATDSFYFDGGDGLQSDNCSASLISAATAFTFFAVYNPLSSTTCSLFTIIGSSNADRINVHAPWGGDIYFDHTNNYSTDGRVQGTAPAGHANNWHIMHGWRDGTSMYVYVDGSLVASDTGMTNTGCTASNVTLYVGKHTSSSGYLTGNIAEMIFFDKAVSSNDIGRIYDHLSYKWRALL